MEANQQTVKQGNARNAAGKLSSDGGRKGTGQSTRRFSRRTATLGKALLRNERERRIRSRLSHEGLGRDRKAAREAFVAQSVQTEISGAVELFRANGRSGRAGSHSDPASASGDGADKGRSQRQRATDVFGSLE